MQGKEEKKHKIWTGAGRAEKVMRGRERWGREREVDSSEEEPVGRGGREEEGEGRGGKGEGDGGREERGDACPFRTPLAFKLRVHGPSSTSFSCCFLRSRSSISRRTRRTRVKNRVEAKSELGRRSRDSRQIDQKLDILTSAPHISEHMDQI